MCPRSRSSRSPAGPSSDASRQEPPLVHPPPLLVKHDYHDFSDEPCDASQGSFDLSILASDKSSFPMKLYFMLEDVQAKGMESIVAWQAHGRSFVVHKPEEFKRLFPRYFKLSKMSSFLRQLNLYGFIRLTRGPDRGGYYHECFLRGRPFLLPRLHRMKIKGTGIRARSDPEHEPNFWRMRRMETGPVQVGYPKPMAPRSLGPTSGPFSTEDESSGNKQPDPTMARFPMNRTLVLDSLSLWAAPIAATSLSAGADNDDKWDGCTMGDIVDDSYLDDAVYGLLKDTDLLFTDMLDMIAST